MIIDESLRTQVIAAFNPLGTLPANYLFPAPRALSVFLEPLVPNSGTANKQIDAKSASFFATAAVDMWLRSVHSFLVSACLTETSPVWSSVSGYYSSHYAIRGLAHVLGYFQLFHKRNLVQLKSEHGRFTCAFRPKNKRGGEHQLYWDLVKQNSAFVGDDLFKRNLLDATSSKMGAASEGEHRNHANYSDHLFSYPTFSVLDKQLLKDRIEQISKIVCYAPPFPRLDNYPDLEYVQLIAYHRIIRFRTLLDDVLGGKNAFWEMHRNPTFAAEFMDFQLTEWKGPTAPASP